ncbi:Rrf2 family transcriptional regulator [Desulfovibrio sp. PG-178-WT-4]|uniref:Rrf2 family transcriptional regulator n=1 Tax=Desulfovibrio porci TaxID=2605782 RepID=A0A6L5XHY2_9BACT|nr:Rrf2 family transcriptional regulator [Desulfovibrio porci]MDY3808928.1 Rrf2 family transcriptional regulator [Desulfovibrio porci]MSS26719.1 Rrf2 family transcriptional regulator [Desulfovibrio porci]
MKLSAKTRYAARILFYMAKHNPSEPVSSNLLAAKTGISSQFIEQILRQLRLAGITGSVRGAKGGHTLLRKPEELTFGCIVRLMEGGIELTSCLESPEACARFGDCAVRNAWESLQGTLDGALESITLDDILRNEALCPALSPPDPSPDASERDLRIAPPSP